MASVNKCILIGNLVADPETRYLPSSDAVCNIRLATSERYKDKATGEMKEATEYHRISFFGRLAEIATEYLKKGSSCYIEGRIKTRKYTDQAGVDKYSTEIVADQMKMLSSRSENDGSQRPGNSTHSNGLGQRQRVTDHSKAPARAAAPAGGDFQDDDLDVPF